MSDEVFYASLGISYYRLHFFWFDYLQYFFACLYDSISTLGQQSRVQISLHYRSLWMEAFCGSHLGYKIYFGRFEALWEAAGARENATARRDGRGCRESQQEVGESLWVAPKVSLF
jgi:hypothetical protein